VDVTWIVVAALVVALVLSLRAMQRWGWIDLSGERVRRGSGHALMGMREFIEPSVGHVAEVEEQAEEGDKEGDDPKLPPPPFGRPG
jgi:hypothetical protein